MSGPATITIRKIPFHIFIIIHIANLKQRFDNPEHSKYSAKHEIKIDRIIPYYHHHHHHHHRRHHHHNYTCQLFLRYKREIFILGVLGFFKTTRSLPKIPEEVRRRPKSAESEVIESQS